ncbi:MAG: restriction endonuclease, partial [Flavobacteriales bacterium]|nr:restriction endonuclease [Flavobacteriales bacterium]
TISKLSSNQPITTQELVVLEGLLFDGEERGTKDEFAENYGEQPLGKFVRSILGLDVAAANEAFSEFIRTGNLTADQITFINGIISFLEKNGTIEPEMLFESPFDEMHDQGISGLFDNAKAHKVISIIREINGNAEVA